MTRKEELVDKLIAKALTGCHERRPGAVIEKLKGDDVELVKDLTAEDFNHRVI